MPLVESLGNRQNFNSAVSRAQLIELGLTMIDPDGSCPLCDLPWSPGELREHLESKLAAIDKAQQQLKKINTLAEAVKSRSDECSAAMRQVLSSTEGLSTPALKSSITSWVNELTYLSEVLSEPIVRMGTDESAARDWGRLRNLKGLITLLAEVRKLAEDQLPEVSAELTSWEVLTKVEAYARTLEREDSELRATELACSASEALYEAFVSARDDILRQLYEQIRNRFVEFYKLLHAEDEEPFEAAFEAAGPALNLEVGFYGRGSFPPHAVHSEGHQDSMGLCLFLALSEHLTSGILDLCVLDDVMMSVDSGHRRYICELLKECFPDRQFIITTHDKTWARQLRTEGVVTGKGSLEFYNWSVDTGPHHSYQEDLWESIQHDLDRDDVPNAAFRLRRALEEFFGSSCNDLQARVRYRADGRWELGDFLQAAMGRYKDLLKTAKAAAASWDNSDELQSLSVQENQMKTVFARSQVELWAINSSVHFNNWANLSKTDFLPVVESFQDLCGLFRCGQCGGSIRIAMMGLEESAAECPCGSFRWNLKKR